MDLHILRDQPLVKFDRQLPIFNWPYPFDREEELLKDHLRPYLDPRRIVAARRAVYIHIPFCDTICSFCPFQKEKYRSEDTVDEYVEALIAEMDMKRAFLGRCAVDAIFVGGGTPSVLNPRQLELLGEAISRNFDLRSLHEFTCEIEVKSVSREKLQTMRDIGINRISFGAQTFSDQYRDLMNLDATRKQLVEAAALLNSMFSYTNVDVLYGMAGQDFEHVRSDLLAAADLQTTTIDVYPINNLSASRRMHAEMDRAGLEVLPEATRVQFRMLIELIFANLGYAPISGYGFAKKTQETNHVVQHSPKFLYHDLIYGHYDDEIIGYGSSAITQIPGFNIYNYANRRAYVTAILGSRELPQLSYGPVPAPERGVVSFPFRGTLEKGKVVWSEVPGETLGALQEALEADLVVDCGDTYALTKVGWLFYVNLMYYLMPTAGKAWLTARIEKQTSAGKRCGDTDLRSLRVMTQQCY